MTRAHHWTDPATRPGELRRIARRVVVVAGDADAIDRLWLTSSIAALLAQLVAYPLESRGHRGA